MENPILVVIFLRGGADGLSLISPSGDKDYIAARPSDLRVARKGETAGHVLKNAFADVDFRFHNRAKGIAELYEAGELAVVHAAGLNDGTRSHFDAEDRMERAAPGASASSGGWLGRWMNAVKPEGILPALAVGAAAPDSLRGSSNIVVAEEIAAMRIAGGHSYASYIRASLTRQLGGDAILGVPLKRLLKLSEAVEARVVLDENGNLKPYVSDVEYPADNPLSRSLKTVAQTIKIGLGLRVSTVDFGNWDSHINQAGQLNDQIAMLSSALMAFWKDLGNHRDYVSVVVMSEFGRRLKSNESGGTDHGHGNAMMMLGAKVKGGHMYGKWPGLANDDLDEGADLAITTDYRLVLSEMMGKHMWFADMGKLFPGFEAEPLCYLR
jgi:uncharacterized protein (DUF1501 family)